MDNKNLYQPIKMTPRRDPLKRAKRQYDLAGGQITAIPSPAEDKNKIPSSIHCSKCDDWQDGKGSTKCLTCSSYKRFQVKNTPRSQIPADIMPYILLEAIADLKPKYNILEAIQRLPDDLAAILSMHYVAGLSTRSIAGIMQISEPSVRRRMNVGMTHLKKIFAYSIK